MNIFLPNEHNRMEVVINQFAGLGDILFIEPIYRWWHGLGYSVIAPVNPDILWVQEYIPYVKFVDKNGFDYNPEVVEQKKDGRLHVPLRFANPLYRGFDDLHYGDDRKNWMGDKYLYLGLEVDMWRTMNFERNLGNEYALYDKLGITGPYNLVNEHFGGSFERVEIKPDNGLQDVYLRKIDNFSLIDWLKVIENAENIYTVETSIMWLIEAFKTKAVGLHLYPRFPWLEDTKYIRSYLYKNWIFHDKTEV